MAKAILISSFAPLGGTQRFVVNLIKPINFDYLILFDDRNIGYSIPIPKERIISLNSPGSENLVKKFIINLPLRYYRLKKIKEKYNIDLCLSLDEPPNLLNIITKGKGKVILSFHCNYSKVFSEGSGMGGRFVRNILKLLYKIISKNVYKNSDLMVAVSNDVKEDLVKNFKLSKNKIVVIYYPLILNEINEFSKEPLEEYQEVFNYEVLITSGRLTKQKGQWYLLRIFRELKKDYPQLKLVILGEGELKEYLVNLSEDLGLKTFVWDRNKLSDNFDVYFLGFQKNPFKFIAKAKLFLFPSLLEGLPNALIEATACGIPVITSDCRSGPREILAPDTDFQYQTKKPEFAQFGVLMPVFEVKYKRADEPLEEVEKMWIEVISEFLEKKDLRERYALAAKERAKDFDIEIIAQEWSNSIRKL